MQCRFHDHLFSLNGSCELISGWKASASQNASIICQLTSCQIGITRRISFFFFFFLNECDFVFFTFKPTVTVIYSYHRCGIHSLLGLELGLIAALRGRIVLSASLLCQILSLMWQVKDHLLCIWSMREQGSSLAERWACQLHFRRSLGLLGFAEPQTRFVWSKLHINYFTCRITAVWRLILCKPLVF